MPSPTLTEKSSAFFSTTPSIKFIGGVPINPATNILLSDANLVSDWAKDSVAWAVEQGIISGRTATTIVPGANATRAEVASMIQRYIVSAAITTTGN